jgi:hypothetical protein
MAAKVRFTIEGKPGAVTLPAFLDAFKHQLTILRDVDAALSGKPGGVLQWYITDLSLGSFSIGAEARVEDDTAAEDIPRTYPGEVVRTYRHGMKVIEGEGSSPPYFTDKSLRAAKKSFQLIGHQGVSGYRVTGDKRAKPIEISARSAVNVEELIRPGVTVYGSVEGRLNVISVAGEKWKFVVFTAIHKKGVACYFPEDKLDEVTSSLRKRVLVTGMLTYNRRGEPQKVKNASWRVLRERSELPTTDDMYGRFPDLIGNQTTTEYLAEVRGE